MKIHRAVDRANKETRTRSDTQVQGCDIQNKNDG